MNLARLTDPELLRHAHNSADNLTTDLETELQARLVAQTEELDDYHGLQDMLEAQEVEEEDLRALCIVLVKFNATTPGTLREKLERADKFYEIASEAGDIFARLSSLTAQTV